MTVVKVGGSLYDHPRLGPGLRQFVADLAGPVVLVPGGGAAADVVRIWDRTHGLGEESSHWLALRSLTLAAKFLRVLVPGVEVIDPFAFAIADESRPGALPHSWDVTSDSVAARVAVVRGAWRLVLLKSVDDGDAARHVDAYFARTVAGAKFVAEAVNFRRVLDI